MRAIDTLPPCLDAEEGQDRVRFHHGAPVARGLHRDLHRAYDSEAGADVWLLSLPNARAEGTGNGPHRAALRSAAMRAATVRSDGLLPASAVLEIAVEDEFRVAVLYRDDGYRTLAELLADSGPVALSHALELVRRVAIAVAGFHRVGATHGCIDHDCILLNDRLEPQLVGGGVVDPILADLRRAGCLDAVDSSFVAPEQRSYGRSVQRTDIFALGRLLSSLLDEWSAPPESVRAFIARCTANRPQDRFDTIDDLVAALQGLQLETSGARASSEPAAEAAPEPVADAEPAEAAAASPTASGPPSVDPSLLATNPVAEGRPGPGGWQDEAAADPDESTGNASVLSTWTEENPVAVPLNAIPRAPRGREQAGKGRDVTRTLPPGSRMTDDPARLPAWSVPVAVFVAILLLTGGYMLGQGGSHAEASPVAPAWTSTVP